MSDLVKPYVPAGFLLDMMANCGLDAAYGHIRRKGSPATLRELLDGISFAYEYATEVRENRGMVRREMAEEAVTVLLKALNDWFGEDPEEGGNE